MMTKKRNQSAKDYLFWVPVVVSLLAIFYVALTIFKPGVPSGHDIAAHSLRLKIFNEALKQGQIPPRWAEGGVADNVAGLPLFNFYQAGFYWFVSGVSVFVTSLASSMKIAIVLLWWLGALFMFLLVKKFGLVPGLLAAVVFAFTPYLISDIFVRAAYPEFAAIVFSVGLLWTLDRLFESNKKHFAGLFSLFLTLTILFHLPTLIIISPVVVGYILLLIINNKVQLQSLLQLTIGGILGIAISSYYLLPALSELDLINREFLTSDKYNFAIHFVFPEQLINPSWGHGISVRGPNDDMPFQIGFVHILMLISGIGALFYVFKKNREIASYLIFWFVVVLYGLFFAHDISLAFWEGIERLQFVQYPWRFLMVFAIATPVIAGIVYSLISNIRYKLGIFLILIVSLFGFYRSFFTPIVFLPEEFFNIDSEEWQTSQGVQENFAFEPGYLPAGVIKRLPDPNIPKVQIVNGRGEIILKEVKFHEIHLTTESETPLIVRVNTHYFPGWKAFIDFREAEINNDNSYKLMDLEVPAGIHKIEVIFTDTLARKIGNALTVIGFIALLVWQIKVNWLSIKKVVRDVR